MALLIAATRTEFFTFCGCLRSLHPAEVWIAIVLDNSSTFPPELTAAAVTGSGANNVELAYVVFDGSCLNRIEAQFTAQR